MVRKVYPKFFNFVVCNLCQSPPSSTILVPLWLNVISLTFFYLCKVLYFSGFLQFIGNFVGGQNNSKHHDWFDVKKYKKIYVLNIFSFRDQKILGHAMIGLA